MNEINNKGADEMQLEFKAVLKLILKLLELGNIEEAKEAIHDILSSK